MTKPKISLNCALLSSSANLAPNNSTLLRSALLRNWKIVNARKISKWLQKLYFAILKKDQKGNFLEYFFIVCTQKHVTHEMGTASEKQKQNIC